MLSKGQIKLIQSLGQKKYRKQQKLFVAESTKIAEEFLCHSGFAEGLTVKSIYALPEWLQREEKLWKAKKNIQIQEITEAELKRISFLTTPQEVLLLVSLPSEEM